MKKILIDFGKKSVRTALVEDGRLVELAIDRRDGGLGGDGGFSEDDGSGGTQAGNVYVGIVQRILPGQFAFIDIGADKNAFLNLNDHKEAGLYSGKKLLLRQGGKVIVQVVRDRTGDKGAAVTTQLTFTGNLIALFKSLRTKREIGISKKIVRRGERSRLKKIVEKLVPEGYGVIVRTECEDKSEDEIEDELQMLTHKMHKHLHGAEFVKAPSVLYREPHIVGRTLQSLLSPDVGEVWVNDVRALQSIRNIIHELRPTGVAVGLHEGETPVFDELLERQIDNILKKKVWLKSGGFLVIERTEACWVADVNTGKFSGGGDQQQTALKTNIEAAVELARQMRLRNASGMIVVDFIDLKSGNDRKKLLDVLEDELKKDRIPVHVAGMTELGLVLLTRKKTREPLIGMLTCECSHCMGSGRVRVSE